MVNTLSKYVWFNPFYLCFGLFTFMQDLLRFRHRVFLFVWLKRSDITIVLDPPEFENKILKLFSKFWCPVVSQVFEMWDFQMLIVEMIFVQDDLRFSCIRWSILVIKKGSMGLDFVRMLKFQKCSNEYCNMSRSLN